MFRIGIIGIGNMGSVHLKNIVSGNVKDAVLTAVCDIDKEKFLKVKDIIPEDVLFFDNHTDLINSGKVDGVLIATPHYDHPVIAIDAFNAGLHVFCEKPAGVYTKNVREMNEAAEKSKKAFQMNFVLRTNGAFRKIKEMLDNKELGDIKRITWIITNWYRSQVYFNSGGWRATWAGEGGGTLLNQNPHQLDILCWFFGLPKRLLAACYFGKNRDIEVEDEATAYMEYQSGMVGMYATSVSEFPGTNRLEIAGDMGKLVFEDNKITFFKNEVSEKEFNARMDSPFGPIPLEVIDVPFDVTELNDCQALMVSNWVDSAQNGAKLICPGTDGINSLLMSNAMYLSSWNENKWIDIPFDEDEFHGKLLKKIETSTYKKVTVKDCELDMNSSFTKQ